MKKPRAKFRTVMANKRTAIQLAAGLEVHPVDQLKMIRAQVKDLEKEAAFIRDLILDGEISMEGERYRARIQDMPKTVYDVPGIIERYGDGVREFERTIVTRWVMLDLIEQ